MIVSALFVAPGGPYCGLADVDPELRWGRAPGSFKRLDEGFQSKGPTRIRPVPQAYGQGTVAYAC